MNPLSHCVMAGLALAAGLSLSACDDPVNVGIEPPGPEGDAGASPTGADDASTGIGGSGGMGGSVASSGPAGSGAATADQDASIGGGGAPPDAGVEDSAAADADACSGLAVLCPLGAVWSREQCGCVPEAQCRADADCHLESSYCDTCTCLALPSGATSPRCEGTLVSCALNPCLTKSAACLGGACVVL